MSSGGGYFTFFVNALWISTSDQPTTQMTMKLKLTLAALAATAISANAATISTSFEGDDGFTASLNNAFDVSANGATWKGGGSGNYHGIWSTGAANTGANVAIVCFDNNFLFVDVDGSDALTSLEFYEERLSPTGAGNILVQWTTDFGVDGSEALGTAGWTTFADSDATISANGSSAMTFRSIDLAAETGGAADVKIRFIGGAGTTNGILIDDVTIASVPEPSSTALIGLGGLALILRRRK